MGQSGDYPFFYLLCFEKVQTKKQQWRVSLVVGLAIVML